MNHQLISLDRNQSLISLLNSIYEKQGMLSTLKSVTYEKNDFFYNADRLPRQVFFIKSGRVKIGKQVDSGKEFIKAIAGADELFGELSAMGQYDDENFAVAMEKTIVYVIAANELASLLKMYPELGFIIIRKLGTRLIETEKRLEALFFKSSRSRIIDFIKNFATYKGEQVGFETVIRKVLTHQEIASFTATSRQTVTTVLNELRKKNILAFNRRRMLIRNMEWLQAQSATG